MKKSNLIIICFLLSICINTASAFTDNCYIVTETNDIEELINKDYNYSGLGDKLLGENGMKNALYNLKQYCCNRESYKKLNKEDKANCTNDTSLKNVYNTDQPYFESPFLFEQLMVTILKRLDTTSASGAIQVEPDEKAVEWKTKMEEIAENIDGNVPAAVTKLYNDYWEFQEKYLIPEYNGVSNDSYGSAITSRNEEHKIFDEYEERSLLTKYYNVCQTVIYILSKYERVFEPSDLKQFQLRCSDKTSGIINKYVNYTVKIAEDQSDKAIANNIENYITYLNERLERLNAKQTRITTILLSIVRQITRVVETCS